MIDLNQCKNIVIAGGGTAGWIASFFAKEIFGEDANIIVLEPSNIGTIGAGEGTFRNFHYFLKRYEINEKDFMENCKSTYKLGIKYIDWKEKGHSYYHHFLDHIISDLDKYELGKSLKASWSIAEKLNYKIDKLSSYYTFCENGLSQKEFEIYRDKYLDNGNITWGYHFDATNVAKYLKEIATERGINVVDDNIIDVQMDNGNISNVITKNGKKIKTDFIFDATGFRQIVIKNLDDFKWISFEDDLIVDSAIPFIIENEKNEEPKLFTTATALKNGWMWDIPTANRHGCGYVYSSKYIDADKAQEEVEIRIGKKIQPIKNLKIRSGVLNKVLVGNCMAIGLSAGFVEPLEATAIAQTIAQLDNLRHLSDKSGNIISNNQKESLNIRTKKTYENIRDFLLMHYNSNRIDSAFWRDFSCKEMPASLQEKREILKSRLPRDNDSCDGYFALQVFFPAYSYYAVYSPMGLLDKDTVEKEISLMDENDLEFISSKLNNIIQNKDILPYGYSL